MTGKEREVLHELISALSSLHMEDTIVDDHKISFEPEDNMLDEKYVYAKHAVDHIASAISILGCGQEGFYGRSKG